MVELVVDVRAGMREEEGAETEGKEDENTFRFVPRTT